MAKGRLYLIPVPISESALDSLPAKNASSIQLIKYFLAEDLRTARRFLSSLKIFPSIESLDLQVLNKDTKPAELKTLMQPLLSGEDMGVLSESGCPGVADPGALAVDFAHRNGTQVVPLVGPSSILLSLMASGLNGQQFAFHGYLPIDAQESKQRIKDLERESKSKNQTQIFIETPYRNNQLFTFFVKTLADDTRLTVALDLTGAQESIQTKFVREWKGQNPSWPKEPAVFLFLA